jgi:adenine-specific DNA-methyltransferase
MTPPAVARLMASMLSVPRRRVRLLDPGAGVGSLTAAAVAELLGRARPPDRITVVAYELEPLLADSLNESLELCADACAAAGVLFEARVEIGDFLAAAAEARGAGFDCAIVNPPYRKLRADSRERELCRTMGLEVPNLYAAFVGAAALLLEEGAELVAITPRSFANGPYFRAFRTFLLDRIALRRLHVFDSRSRAFRDDAVLQENVILHAEKTSASPERVTITASATPSDPIRSRELPWGRVVYEHDAERFIHLVETDEGAEAAAQVARFGDRLADLGLSVSTGPVVDFRATAFLRHARSEGAVPLLYPTHLDGGTIRWPRGRAKWNALALTEESISLTVPSGDYVLVKRFTAKEERRRVVAAVLEADRIGTERIGLENHLNLFHKDGRGLPLDLARGLAIYLNSTLVDMYFRQFSGHTQVNAADLRNIPYPRRDQLQAVGRAAATSALGQEDVDRLVEQHVLVAT